MKCRINRSRLAVLMSIILAGFLSQSAWAVNKYFLGTGGVTDWSAASGWQNGDVAGTAASDVAYIRANCVLMNTRSFSNLYVDLSGNLDMTGSAALILAGTVNLKGTTAGTTPTLSLFDSSSLTATNSSSTLYVGAGNSNLAYNGELFINGSSMVKVRATKLGQSTTDISTAYVAILGGTLETEYFMLQSSVSAKVLVSGGVLYTKRDWTATNPSKHNVKFDGGEIRWSSAQTTQTEINGYIDSGYLISGNYTAQQMKDAVTLTNGQYVLSLPVPTAVFKGNQKQIPTVQMMTNTVNYAAILDWYANAYLYYDTAFDPNATGPDMPVIFKAATNNTGFSFPSNLGPMEDRKVSTEFQSAAAAVIGAEMLGMSMTNFNGTYDFKTGCLEWWHKDEKLWRNYKNDVYNKYLAHGIYGWVPCILGAYLGDIYSDDSRFTSNMLAQSQTILAAAHSFGCPTNANLTLAYYPETGTNQPLEALELQTQTFSASLAWLLYMGYQVTTNSDYLNCSKSAMEWFMDHPSTVEGSSDMAPLVAARGNAEQGWNMDMDRIMNITFCDTNALYEQGTNLNLIVARNCRPGGVLLDGQVGKFNPELDPDNSDNSIHSWFSQGASYAGYLVPTARYDQRYARDIGHFLMNLAHSSRYVLGIDLDADHQPHLPWRESWTNEMGFIFPYEGVRTYSLFADTTEQKSLRPYAFGDGQYHVLGFKTNHPQYWIEKDIHEHEAWDICIYMANYYGFLGAIFDYARYYPGYEGVLKWDCTLTDFYKDDYYTTYLVYNPYPVQRSFDLADVEDLAGSSTADIYDAVGGVFLRDNVSGSQTLEIGAGQAMVLVFTPGNGTQTVSGSKLMVNNRVIDYRYAGNGLFAEYYNNTNFTNRVCSQIDPQLNMTWSGSPAASVNADNFCARWTGWVVPEYSEIYTLKLIDSGEGAKVWIDDVLVSDDWNSLVQTNTITVALKQNVPTKVRIDYRETTGTASVKLYWSSLSQAEEIIPQSRLAPAPDTAAKISSYTASRTPNASHPDTTPPSKLIDGLWGSASGQSVQYDGDVTITATLSVPAKVAEAGVRYYHYSGFSVDSIGVETSTNGTAWVQASTRKITAETQASTSVPAYKIMFPVNRQATHIRFTVKKTAASTRILLGEILAE